MAELESREVSRGGVSPAAWESAILQIARDLLAAGYTEIRLVGRKPNGQIPAVRSVSKQEVEAALLAADVEHLENVDYEPVAEPLIVERDEAERGLPERRYGVFGYRNGANATDTRTSAEKRADVTGEAHWVHFHSPGEECWERCEVVWPNDARRRAIRGD